ncbi:hypothetical protein ACJ5H2_01220 [Nocardioides sp. R1-1]|uniref:hypothetical protein n=1 Tax=Nocardioides sp. R1-1 TaxID=3383502 RepID=UPI0038CF8958
MLVDGQPPADTTPVLTTIEELTTAAPAGTRVILLANPARSADQLAADTPGLVVEGEGTVLPAGAPLLSPRMQGLLFRDETGAFASGLAEGEGDWGWLARGTPRNREFASLVDELDRMG